MQTEGKIVQEVNVRELETILANTPMIKGMAKFAFLTQFTAPKCLKKCRQTKEPFTGIVNKRSTVSVLLNTTYETVVTNRLEREGKEKTDYKRGENSMPLDKTQSKNNFFGYFNGKGVLEYKPNEGQIPEVKYYLNGKETDKSQLPDVLPARTPAKNQGLDKEVPWRKVYVMNIEEISIDGYHYKIKK